MSSPKKLPSALLWLAAVAAAFGAGVWLAPKLTGLLNKSAQEKSDDTPSSDADKNSRVGPRKAAAEADSSPASGSLGAAYASFVQCHDSRDRLRNLLATLDAIGPDNWKQAWDLMIESIEQVELTDEECIAIQKRIGEFARSDVMGLRKPNYRSISIPRDFGSHAIAGWAAKEPGASWTFAKTLPPGEERRIFLRGWFDGAGAADPEHAMAMSLELDPSDRECVYRLNWHLAEVDPAKVRAWLEALSQRVANSPPPAPEATDDPFANKTTPEKPIDARLFSGLLDAQIQRSRTPESAEQLQRWHDAFIGSPVLPGDSLLIVTARLMEIRQPHAGVLDWLGQHGNSSQANEAASMILKLWSKNDARTDEAAAWLQQHRDSNVYDGAVLGFVARVRSFDPEGARAWANTIKDAGLKEQALGPLAKLPAR